MSEAGLCLPYCYICFHPLWESQNVRKYRQKYFILLFGKPVIFGVPRGILRDAGTELVKTHKTWTVLGKQGRMGSLCVPITRTV
jgi:hypothetical protein